MTLIAGMKRDGATFLVGDARQSLVDGRVLNPGRKLHILRPPLAVAWTGHRIAAEAVIAQLRSKLPQKPTWETVKYYLTMFPLRTPARSEVVIVGAFRDAAEDVVFKWNSKRPRYLTTRDVLCEGSGADVIQSLIETPGEFWTDTGARAPGVEILSDLAHLAAIDFQGDITRDRGFGFAYELASNTAIGMCYVPRVRYFSVRAAFDEAGKLSSPPLFGKGFMSVDSSLDRALIERWHPQDNAIDRALLLDIDKPKTTEDLSLARERLNSVEPLWVEDHDFTVAAVLLSGPAVTGVHPGAFVQVMQAEQAIQVVKRQDAYMVGINGSYLENLYASLARMAAAR